MHTIPETYDPVEMAHALRQSADLARERYAGEAARLDRGLLLALNRHVTLHADGTATVQSGSQAEVLYMVTTGRKCDCHDWAQAPDGRCKHVWARALVQRAALLLHTPDDQAEASVVPEPPVMEELPPLVLQPEQYEPAPVVDDDETLVPFLPEAGASLNIEVKVGHTRLMYTLRGHDDASVLARLPVVVEALERLLHTEDEDASFLTRLAHACFPRLRQYSSREV